MRKLLIELAIIWTMFYLGFASIWAFVGVCFAFEVLNTLVRGGREIYRIAKS